jgi:SAM-dependent methyltransferase
MTVLLDLGGGTAPHPQARCVIDLHHPVASPKQDATNTPWLWHDAGGMHAIPDATFDVVHASHFLEHVPHGAPLIRVMNEAWRVLRPGGRFHIRLPLVGYTEPETGMGKLVSGWQPYADPTHVSFWWFPEALLYVCEGPFKPHADYGMSVWRPLGGYTDDPWGHPDGGWCVVDGWEGWAALVKP